MRSALRHLIEEVAEPAPRAGRDPEPSGRARATGGRDLLAPIRNRRAFLRDLARGPLVTSSATGRPIGLLYFDVNGLKEINDRFGHAAGDAALLHVAERVDHADAELSTWSAAWGATSSACCWRAPTRRSRCRRGALAGRGGGRQRVPLGGRGDPDKHGLRRLRPDPGAKDAQLALAAADRRDVSPEAGRHAARLSGGRPWSARVRGAGQAMMSGSRSLSSRMIRSRSASFCFFRRCSSS